MLCSVCGASLANVPLKEDSEQEKASQSGATYDRRYGEIDLFEGEVRHRRGIYLFSALLLVGIVVCGGIILAVGARLINPPTAASNVTLTPNASPLPALGLSTNTPRPSTAMATLFLPTVTQAPPSFTPTATEGPCQVVVQPGDFLSGLAYACGHRSLDVIPIILEENNLADESLIQVGQTLLIPWPTPTLDPAAVQPTDSAEEAGESSASLANPDAATNIALIATLDPNLPTITPTLFPSATLLPGVAWHVVQTNENMIQIAYTYSTNAETLSQLNPEIPFSQCDFQFDTGGPRCTVILQQGQQLRVPAPTPTATLSPTLSGSETATPMPTATFNAPSLFSPGDRARFAANDIITLRWVPTGTLGVGEAYRVTVTDLVQNTSYTADTTELFYILPEAWLSEDRLRRDYEWQVSVIAAGVEGEETIYTTEPSRFIWGDAPPTPTPTEAP